MKAQTKGLMSFQLHSRPFKISPSITGALSECFNTFERDRSEKKKSNRVLCYSLVRMVIFSRKRKIFLAAQTPKMSDAKKR